MSVLSFHPIILVWMISLKMYIFQYMPVTSGVPQGSILGPVLFLLFVNDLPDEVVCATRLFADDTKIWATFHPADPSTALQQDLDNLMAWSGIWQLQFNCSKCKVMHFGRNNPCPQYTMQSQDDIQVLQAIDEEKDLGVILDPTLSFNRHITAKVAKANQFMGMVRRVFADLDKEMFLILYKTKIRPHMEYATTVWNPYLLKDIRRVEGVQRRATKLVKEIAHLPYPDRLKHLGLPTLEYRRLRADMIQVFKIVNKIDDLDQSEILNTCGATNTRGHSFKIRKECCNTTRYAKAFRHRVISPWNALPDDVVNSTSINMFKSRLNKHWKMLPCKFHPSC